MLARTPAKAAPELEIKFQLGDGALEALEADLFPVENGALAQLHAVYFDTPIHDLRDGGFSLRVRRKGDTYIQTLKHRGGGGLFERDEWESEVPGAELDLHSLAGAPVCAVIGDARMAPAFTVDVDRRTHVWTQGEARVEVVFDNGLILAGERQEAIAEMELELLAGSPEALFELARLLQSKANLTLAFESKAQRGYRLAGHDGVAALRAQASAVDEDTPAGAALQLIVRDALVQIAGNARLLERAHNPEVLHQMRVGLRRLRAALSVFKGILDAKGLGAARDETHWLAGELSEARDIDVFLQRAGTPDEIEESPGRAAFFRALRIAQAEAYEHALAAVRSDRFRLMLFNLAEWIEIGDWLRLSDQGQAEFRDGSAAALAAPVLDKLDKRVRDGARRLGEIDAEARHDLRKQAKKLRYAAAFFGGAFPDHPKRRRRFVNALKVLQDRLGELNDMAVARAVAQRAVGRRAGDVAFAAGLEVGRLTRDEGPLIEIANTALKAFRRTRRFWAPPHGRNEDVNVSRSRSRRA